MTLSYLNTDYLADWRFTHVCYVTCNGIMVYMVSLYQGGLRGRDLIAVRITATYAISVYHNWCCEFECRWWWGVLDVTLYDSVYWWFAAVWWFSPGTSIPSPNKADCLCLIFHSVYKTDEHYLIYYDVRVWIRRQEGRVLSCVAWKKMVYIGG